MNDRDIFVFYLAVLTIFIIIGVLLNLFDIFKKYRYLPCSAISGSFYIMKGIKYIIGGYFSSILYLKNNHKCDFGKIKEISLTYFFIHILIIVFSIFFQIKYIEMKEITIPDDSSTNSSSRNSNINTTSRPSKLSINSIEGGQKEDESLLGSKFLDESSTNEENEINDQED